MLTSSNDSPVAAHVYAEFIPDTKGLDEKAYQTAKDERLERVGVLTADDMKVGHPDGIISNVRALNDVQKWSESDRVLYER
ncbi:MAG: hypothetical protein AAF253_13005 [Pseudomonadota bacterium]